MCLSLPGHPSHSSVLVETTIILGSAYGVVATAVRRRTDFKGAGHSFLLNLSGSETPGEELFKHKAQDPGPEKEFL